MDTLQDRCKYTPSGVLHDRCKYTLPLNEYGEVVYNNHTTPYQEKINTYLDSLPLLSETEKENKSNLFSLTFVKRLVNYSSPAIVDRYAYSMENLKAMNDLYMVSIKHMDRKKNEDTGRIKFPINTDSIEEARRARAIFNEAVAMFGDIDSGATVGSGNNAMTLNMYKVICYMRDHDINKVWTYHLCDMSSNPWGIDDIYNGFEYDTKSV
ncbi:hypothetical protein [Enterobacter pseudoroggenkampii]|uniref:hypothetical protein n=1 Tax=Enterobacter pseudoroggenkampii TaxID=2996112 RepID=UPI002264FA3A|nr:hypothetical protein [Enterobacter pseudoroggenkampii]MCX8289106.1 hypothetical protein [Enterobacter pseudoroggenkampii]